MTEYSTVTLVWTKDDIVMTGAPFLNQTSTLTARYVSLSSLAAQYDNDIIVASVFTMFSSNPEVRVKA